MINPFINKLDNLYQTYLNSKRTENDFLSFRNDMIKFELYVEETIKKEMIKARNHMIELDSKAKELISDE